MKRIQIESIEKTANVAVVICDVHFVARAINAAAVLKSVEPKKSEEMKFENGSRCPVMDEDGNVKQKYNIINSDDVAVIYGEVMPFLEDLKKALIGNEN